jgi:hypothetical protein
VVGFLVATEPSPEDFEKYKFLNNFILVYCGVLLSLSLRLLTDDLMSTLRGVDIISQIIIKIQWGFWLGLITSLYYLEDVIENIVFISKYPYRSPVRFYVDIFIFGIFYFCILLAVNNSIYYLILLPFIFVLNLVWSKSCIRRKAGPEEYHKFSKTAYSWGIVYCCVGILLWYIFYDYPQDILLKYYTYFVGAWIIFYHIARTIVIRRIKTKEQNDSLYFLEAGIITIIFLKISYYLFPSN